MPRKTREFVSECQLTPKDQDRFQRAEAANDNGFVSLPFFAAAIVAGNLAKLPNKTLNNVAALYIGSRIAFNMLYIFGTTNASGIARSVAWLAGMGGCLSLFVQAGKTFQKAIF
ncbi:hypothetical protein A1Q1_06404 [Trichosporon asahii var. asahii CBS 2479]|nr:hypothetical protein A1Q1_06404 [Trichosporon asahii var. asahii CBS 2479]EJT45266.1 hypothetical protein A1Q1_06404 [Trichosporon asahii var. asahii CBS 2479]